VIESSFATIRHRTVRSKGCLSNKTVLAMIFKLAEAAEKSWRRLDGHNHLPKVILLFGTKQSRIGGGVA
jgi:putative transposase